MSLISTLHVASSALEVFSRAIDIEGGNVANAATPGYAAMRTSIQAIGPGGPSAGSDYVLVSSAGDLLSDVRVQSTSSDAAWSATRVEALAPLNQLFDITGTGGILGAFQQFSAAFSDLAVTPNDALLREAALSAAGTLSGAIRKAAAAVDAQRSQIDSAIDSVSGEINKLTELIRDANIAIRSSEQPDGTVDAGRRAALDALSSLIDITVTQSPDGSVNVLTGGQQPLVMGDQVYSLTVTVSSQPPGQVSSAGGGASPGVYSGKLGALLDIRNTTIQGLVGSQNGVGTPGSLNTLARGFAARVNSLLSSGLSSPGVAGVPIFAFDPTNDTNVARTLRVDTTVTGDQLALSTSGSTPQVNGIANAIARLFNSDDPADEIGGVKAQTYYASIAVGVGQQLATAREQTTITRNALTVATAERQRVSGVSLDEAAIAITSLQRYFQASAKLVSILDTLTTTEINLIR